MGRGSPVPLAAPPKTSCTLLLDLQPQSLLLAVLIPTPGPLHMMFSQPGKLFRPFWAW